MTHTSTEQQAAVKTLQNLGYTYHGGEQWKPPLGNAPDFNLIDRLHARVQELEASQAQRVPLSDAHIESLLTSWPEDGIAFFDFARAIEAAHGITQDKQGCGDTK